LKRVLLCTESWPPVASGGGVQRPVKFARYLRDHGYAAEVLTPEPDERKFLLDPGSTAEVAAVPRHTIPLVRTRRSRLPGDVRRFLDRWHRSVPLPDAFIHSVPAFLARARELHALSPYDLVMTTSPPHSLAVLGLELRRALGIPWVADFRDEWGKNRRRRARFTPEESARDRELERACFREADRVVVTTRVMGRNVLEASGIPPERVAVIPNGYDETDLPPPAPHAYGGRMVLLFTGALNAYRELDALLAAMKEILAGDPRFPLELRLLTPVDRSRRYLGSARGLVDRGVIRVDPFLPHREGLAEAARADVLLHVLSGCGADDEHVPGKLFEYLALERPILFLTSVRGENARILDESGGGITVDGGDPAAIARGLRDLVTRWRAHDLEAIPRDVTRYRRRVLTAHLARVFDALLSSPSSPGAAAEPGNRPGRDHPPGKEGAR
jgi:glycosyltransferase involved in cell wall biosynthesis